MEAWIMDEVARGEKLPGLYPMNEATKARYEAWKKKRRASAPSASGVFPIAPTPLPSPDGVFHRPTSVDRLFERRREDRRARRTVLGVLLARPPKLEPQESIEIVRRAGRASAGRACHCRGSAPGLAAMRMLAREAMEAGGRRDDRVAEHAAHRRPDRQLPCRPRSGRRDVPSVAQGLSVVTSVVMTPA